MGIKVEIGANIEELISAIHDVTDVISEATGKWGSAFGGVGDIVSKVLTNPVLGAAAAIGAVGAAMAKSVKDAAAYNKELDDIGDVLGVGAKEAAVLKIAIENVGGSMESYLAAAQRVAGLTATGSDNFARLGISIKDSSGHLKPTTVLINEAIQKIRGMGSQAEQARASFLIFGRSWGDAQDLLKLTPEVMQEATDEAEKLGTATDKNVELAQKYEATTKRLDRATMGLSVAMGEKLIPIFERWADATAKWTQNEAQDFIKVLGVIGDTLGAVGNVFKLLWNLIQMFVDGMAAAVVMLGGVWTMLSGDVKGGFEKIKNEWKYLNQITTQNINDMKAAFVSLANTYSTPIPAPTVEEKDKKKDKGGPGAADPEAAAKERARRAKEAANARMDDWEKENKLGGIGMKPEALLHYDLQFWIKKQEILESGANKYSEAYADVRKKLAEKFFDIEVRAAELGVDESKKIIQMSAEEIRRFQDEHLSGFALHQADLERLTDIKHSTQAPEIETSLVPELSAEANERIQLEANYLTTVRNLRLTSIDSLLGLYEEDSEEHRRLLEEKEQAERDYQEGIAGLKSQKFQELKAEAQETAQIAANFTSQMFGAMTASGEKFITRIGNAFKSFFLGLAQQLISNFVQKWVTSLLLKEAVDRVEKQAEVTRAAGVAGANAAASQAGIPIVGPALAAAAMAQTSALVLASMMPMASASQGFDVGFENPVTQLHKREMVLPEAYANVIRDLASVGGGSSQEMAPQLVFQITTPDGQSFYQMLKNRDSELIKVLNEAIKDRRF